jgi:chromosomal replication initiator protein
VNPVNSDIWGSVLETLQGQINKQSFDLWLKDTQLYSLSDDQARILVADDVACRHITQNYSQKIESLLQKYTGSSLSCEFITENDFNRNSADSSTRTEKPFLDMESRAMMNDQYTFENFVVGPNNQLAHAAAHSVAKAPATQINPLFFYGNTGLGKTHLMQAIGNDIKDNKPYLKVMYVTSEDFLNEFISSIQTRTQESFKIKYRNVDILLIDDIQFLEGKEETQIEFFHTFNSLYENKKQIVISSDRPPREIRALEDRLRTRFEWGMITDLQPPNLETREAILRNKARKENIDFSDDVIYYIAKRIRSNIRALEAALTRLKMVSSMLNEPITINHAKQHLRELFDENESRKVSIHDVMNRISGIYNVSVDDLKSKSRQSRVVQPRFLAMYVARKLTGLTTTEIGAAFGDRDHSTVVNAINKIEEDMSTNPEMQDIVDEIVMELRQ